ncbi:MAG TPA: hypothetical protein VGK31_12575 [Thermoanaerobaculia bacterium]
MLLLFATSATAADLPRYWAVHIDVPSNRAAYDRLDREFSDTIRVFYVANHFDPPVVIKLVSTDGRYYGLRPRATLADIEKPSILGSDLQKQLQAKTAPISEETHKTLREHHNEIWQIQRDLTTTGEIRPRQYATLRTDLVSPPKNDEYDTAMKQLVSELHNVDVVAFFSVYGDGSYRYLFLSDSPIKVRSLKGLAQTRDVTLHF